MAKRSRPIERLQTTIDLSAVRNLSSLPATGPAKPGSGQVGWYGAVESRDAGPAAPVAFTRRDSTTWR